MFERRQILLLWMYKWAGEKEFSNTSAMRVLLGAFNLAYYTGFQNDFKLGIKILRTPEDCKNTIYTCRTFPHFKLKLHFSDRPSNLRIHLHLK